MCVSKGAPRKPAYGPCNEQHSIRDMVAVMAFMAIVAPVLSMLESALESKIKEGAACV